VVAVARDWTGLARGANIESGALDSIDRYRIRDIPVARLAQMVDTFPLAGWIEVEDGYPGVGSTSFWGISLAFSDFDRAEMSGSELERELALMQVSRR
jgi:hypothetical protein